ncbi:MAG: HlyD family secretion protein, partial [Geminicoccaceae bacterium]
IDKIKVGQKARVRLTAFDQVTTPEVVGEVLSVTADTLIDDRTGHKFYVAMVRLADEQPSGIHDLELVPGMRAEVFVQTGSRTAFSYLVGPLRDRLARSFAEG